MILSLEKNTQIVSDQTGFSPVELRRGVERRRAKPCGAVPPMLCLTGRAVGDVGGSPPFFRKRFTYPSLKLTAKASENKLPPWKFGDSY